MKKEYLEIGKIINSRGLAGELKIEPWCDSQADFCRIKKIYLNPEKASLNVTRIRAHKSFVLMQIDGVCTKEQADALKGQVLYAHRDNIPIDDDRYFIEDIKGFAVSDAATGKNYGILSNIFKAGFNDVYSIVSKNGIEYLLPIIEGTVHEIDIEEGKIFVNPLEGVFDEN